MPIWIVPEPTVTPGASNVEAAPGAVDHVAAAIDRLPVQFRKPRIEAILRAVIAPLQRAENAFQELFDERGVDTAIGAQLDAIGFVVGQPRNGYDDDEYRRQVRARIATNKSRGTFADLIGVIGLVIDDAAATIRGRRSGTAAVRFNIEDVATSDAVADILIGFLREAKAAGVRLTLITGSTPPAGWFTWGAAGLGFGDLGQTTGGKLTAARS